MKRTTLLSGILIVSLLLSACSVVSQGGGQAQAAQNSGNTGNTPRELPLAMKLALGTFKLDQTSTPLDAAEAAQLLFLWKGMRNLSQDQSVANAEIQGLTKQIQDTMTPEQITAINGMNLSFQDIAAIAKETGLDLGSTGGQAGNLSPGAQATFQTARQAGGGGGIPGAGGGGGGGGARIPGFGGGGPSVSSTNTSGGSQTRGSGGAFSKLGISPNMINAIIQYLETKAK